MERRNFEHAVHCEEDIMPMLWNGQCQSRPHALARILDLKPTNRNYMIKHHLHVLKHRLLLCTVAFSYSVNLQKKNSSK
jgi:hypothetical protein